MLPAMRRARIIELLRKDGMASFKDMADALRVSLSTLRRDVDFIWGKPMRAGRCQQEDRDPRCRENKGPREGCPPGAFLR